jgi:uroporphyrin-3 C-methyltransferase
VIEPTTPTAASPAIRSPSGAGRGTALAIVLLALLGAAALWVAWGTQQRVKELEQQLVKRQEDSGAMATEAQLLARQAQDTSREAAAKMALLEARVAEATLQRSQLEELIQSLARSRDENVLADVEASIRVAMQQSAITGSVQPLLATLKQAEQRLVRQDEPRLEGVRRAIVQDLERARAAGAVDIATLAMRLDEAVRLVDELPLLSVPERRAGARAPVRAASAAVSAASAASAPRLSASAAAASRSAASAASAAAAPAWSDAWREGWASWSSNLWGEVRSLIRVTPVDRPEAMLIAPEQAFFLRENLKLRLLNARLALLSRQFDTAQADLRDALSALETYFDRGSKRVASINELLRQVSAQAHQVVVPRPDATLAAIAALSAAR